MSVVNIKKAAIIGMGFVGSSIAFSLMQRGQFDELLLIDASPKKAEGEAMDLSHGLPYTFSVNIHVGSYADIADAALIIITAGAAQKEGETRLDLLKKNAAIMKSIVREIKAVHAEGILLVVANPVDALTHIAYQESGFPKSRVFGSGTVLDTARFKYLLSRHLSVDAKNVHAVIIGEHGDSEVPVWSIANVSGIPVNDFCALRGFTKHDENMKRIEEDVVNSAYSIIEKKGATYYGIALSVSHIASCVVNNTHTMLPVSTELEGEYGISGIALSLPCLVGKNGIEKILPLPLTEGELSRVKSSADTLKEALGTLK